MANDNRTFTQDEVDRKVEDALKEQRLIMLEDRMHEIDRDRISAAKEQGERYEKLTILIETGNTRTRDELRKEMHEDFVSKAEFSSFKSEINKKIDDLGTTLGGNINSIKNRIVWTVGILVGLAMTINFIAMTWNNLSKAIGH